MYEPYKPTNNKWKQSFQFFLAFFIFVFIVIATVPNSWADLKNKNTDTQISKFGLWNTCVKIANQTDLTCKNSHDANFIIYKSLNSDVVYADHGKIVDGICFEYRNVTVVEVVKINGTDEKVNKTELRKFQICQLDYTFDKNVLERCRVFSILVSVISFLVAIIFLIGFKKPEVNGFNPAVLSLLIPIWYIIAVATFASTFGDRFKLVSFEYSWCFILAWLAAILSIFQTLFAFYTAFNN